MPSRPRVVVPWTCLLLLALPRCSCDEGLTKIVEPPPDAGTPEQPGIPLDAGQNQPADAGEADAAEPDAGEADAAVPDSGAPIDQLCDTLPHQTLSRSFTFADVGPCPWGQGDNSPLEGAMGWSARTEQTENIADVPANAIVCSAAFAVPQTDMWFDDAMVIALQGVVLMTDVDVSLFRTDGIFHLYDWQALRGHGGSELYCLGEATGEGSCVLPAMETPGPMSLSISSALARSIGEYASRAGAYEIRVVTIGDNDAGDCRHQPFDFVVTLEFVVP